MGHQEGVYGQAPAVLPKLLPDDPDLAAVVEAWDRLPEAIKAGILAMAKAATTLH